MDKKSFVEYMESQLLEGIKYSSKTHVEKVAAGYGIDNKNLIKELTELAIVRTARRYVADGGTTREVFDKIVNLYYQQVNLSQRTSESMRLQQYSTPAPISYMAGVYAQNGQGKPTDGKQYFEPSAGNGLLTIAIEPRKVSVNELDDIRLDNLKTQGYMAVSRIDATRNLAIELQYTELFDGVLTNPPFGKLDKAIEFDGFPFKILDHIMCIRALECMKDTGLAAMIIGGHTTWDERGRIQAGKNRIFFNYLYNHYNVDDVIQIDGHKLYSRQGTAFDTRLILINGRKANPYGFSPVYNPATDIVVDNFDELYKRVMLSVGDDDLKKADGYYYNGLIWVFDTYFYYPIGTSDKSIRNAISEQKMKRLIFEGKAQPYINDEWQKRIRIARVKAEAKLKLLKL